MVLRNKNKFLFSAVLVLLAFGLTLTSCASMAKYSENMEAATLAAEATALKVMNSDLSVGAVKVEGASLSEKIEWLYKNSITNATGRTYILEINTDESIDPISLYWNQLHNRNLTIIFRGIGANRTIYIKQDRTIQGSHTLKISSGQTLVLDDNITIHGPPSVVNNNNRALVEVSSGGVLVMNEGSTITGGINTECNLSHGGGVHVSSGGAFIMKGGTITNNATFQVPDPIMIAASKGKYNALSKRNCYGAGVYVPGGAFIKTGGTITGYSSDPVNGNVVMGFAKEGVMNKLGHAIYFAFQKNMFLLEGLKSIDTTVGPKDSIYFDGRTFKEIPVAQPVAVPEIQNTAQIVPQETAAAQQEAVPQEAPIMPQEVLQEYETVMQKIQDMYEAALQEYQVTVQENPAAQQEATQKYYKIMQEIQQEYQKAVQKYQEDMQKW